jgi:hypothetical protein
MNNLAVKKFYRRMIGGDIFCQTVEKQVSIRRFVADKKYLQLY